MKYRFFLLGLGGFLLPLLVSADVSQLVFITMPQTISPSVSSEIITIEAQDASGNPVKNNTICLQITSSSQTGEFSTNKETWSAEPVRILNLTLATNQYRRNFYYKDSNVGSHIITAKAALKPEDKTCPQYIAEGLVPKWTVTQNIIVSDTGAIVGQSESVSPEPTPDIGSVSWPVEPQIYANAGKDKTAIVGADVYFSGQALGIEKEPLENARYLWNFGDGAIAENQNVKHVYQYPGEYIVVLDVSSGKYSASDILLVKATPNQLKIIEANEEFVKLQNGSDNNLDISGWALRANGEIFKFPPSTFIKANSVLMISFLVSGIGIGPNKKIELLYSNWSVANSFVNVKHSVFDIPDRPAAIPPTVEQIEQTEQVEQSEQAAGVVVSIEKEDFGGAKKWWGLAGLIGVLSAAVFLFIHRKKPVL